MLYGFDVGGTKIEFGAFDDQLNRVATERVSTPSQNYTQLIETLVDMVQRYDQTFGEQGLVGLGFPGMEQARDQSLLTVNIPCANGQYLRHDLTLALQRNVSIENDANCFALSEAWDASLQDSASVLGLILGTGFGGGLVINGKIFSGHNHIAGEAGHMRLPIDAWQLLGNNAPLFECGCGQRGCIEKYLSGTGFEALYHYQFGEKLKASEIIEHRRQHEPNAYQFTEVYLEFVACCLGNILTVLDPNVVVLGGGLSNFSELYDELPKRLPRYLLSIADCPKIVKAKYGDAGGVRGAAFLNL